jgi:lysophospholipase L1-like esterase
MKTYKYLFIGLLALSLVACEDDDLSDFNASEPLPDLTAGSADFSNYVALGASFTAGFTDGALFIATQENSFPNILAQQFRNAGGGAFAQPLMNDNFGGLAVGGARIADPRLVLGEEGPVPLESIIVGIEPTTDLQINNPTGPFNNMGVPGAKSFHFLFDGYGNVTGLGATANPYFIRMASASNATILGDAVAQNPTFFTISEVGGNDVLGYALSGGDGTNELTDTATFNFAITQIVDAMTSGGAKGAITNVPYVSDLPHFTTVPYNPIPLDEDNANALNQGYALYNGGLQQALAALAGTGLLTEEEVERRSISFSEGDGNAMVIIDENLTDLGAINPAFAGIPQYRQATEDDLFVLTLSSLIPQGYGTQIPLEDKWVLTPEEQSEIQQAADAYNATIEGLAAANDNLALVNLKAILSQTASDGIEFDQFTLTADLVFGGTVGLDGVHLTSRGYALMANKFLEAIDQAFGSNFIESGNRAKAGDYPTNYSPYLQ